MKKGSMFLIILMILFIIMLAVIYFVSLKKVKIEFLNMNIDKDAKENLLDNREYYEKYLIKYYNMEKEEVLNFFDHSDDYEVYNVAYNLKNEGLFTVQMYEFDSFNNNGYKIWIYDSNVFKNKMNISNKKNKEINMLFIIKKENMINKQIEERIKNIKIKFICIYDIGNILCSRELKVITK